MSPAAGPGPIGAAARAVRRAGGALAAALAVALVVACGGGGGENDDSGGPGGPTPGPAVPVGDTVALTAAGQLLSFDRARPGRRIGRVDVLGLADGDTLVGLDWRPADGRLYALGRQGRIYVVDPSTGVATSGVALTPAIGDNQPFLGLVGDRFAVGFDPFADRLRVVGDRGQNLHINVDNGSTVSDAPVNGAQARITAVAHTNALPGAVSTRLFALDSSERTLYLQAVPNDGTLSAPVPLGVRFDSADGFGIDARDSTAYAALQIDGSTHLYTVPLQSGSRAADLGAIATDGALVGLALSQPTRVNLTALTADGRRLLRLDAAAPTRLTARHRISGLNRGETLLGIDYRPSDRRLYGLSSQARILRLDAATGAAVAVSTLSADATDDTAPFTGLAGSHFSVDFDPVEDRLRVIGDLGANLRVDVDTGAVTTDADVGLDGLAGPRTVVAAAHGSNHAGAATTTLYDFVTNNDVLAVQSPPADGTLIEIGGTPFELGPGAAMDIAGGDDGLFLVAARIVPDQPWVLYAPAPVATELGRGNLYRNTRTNYTASFIGGERGPALLDIAIDPL